MSGGLALVADAKSIHQRLHGNQASDGVAERLATVTPHQGEGRSGQADVHRVSRKDSDGSGIVASQ